MAGWRSPSASPSSTRPTFPPSPPSGPGCWAGPSRPRTTGTPSTSTSSRSSASSSHRTTQRPQWPDGAPQQIHLDLYITDLAGAHAEAVALGAELLQAAEDPDAPEGFQVYADPAGHPFCLCWG